MKPRPGTCPSQLSPPPGPCASDVDECMFDWDCEGTTKKCCSNKCFKECAEPALIAAIRGKCPSPKTSRLCHMGLKNLCSNDTECNYIDGGVCCFDGCRRRCATSDSFPDRLETARPGKCPPLPTPEFCIADADECLFDADCYPGRKCCSDTCVKRCVDPVIEDQQGGPAIGKITQGAATGKCPIVSISKRCHIGLAHTCNNDEECPNGTYCCFDGCRRKCRDPSGGSAGAQGEDKNGTCPFLAPPQLCVSDVDECFIDWDCVGNRKCCSNRCFKVCASPSVGAGALGIGNLQTAAAVQCPEPVAYRCTFSLKHLCDDSSTCFTGTVCCFDGCRRRCVPPKGATGTCPKPPENLVCPVGLRNTCLDDKLCVEGTRCCSDGCRKRCKDPAQFDSGDLQGKPRLGTCPALSPPSEFCPSDFDECKFDWDCDGKTKKCCSNGCYRVCAEPAIGAIIDKCPAPTKPSERCHIALKGQCSNDTDCKFIPGGLCCFDGCRRRCATSDGFPSDIAISRPGNCPILQPPQFCVADYDECQFDTDCFPGKKCCNNSCFKRCVNPTFDQVGSVAEEPESNCPITTQSKTCHVGLKNTCNEDDDCLNGTYCCFTGCRRQCWDPDTRQSFTQNKTGSCPALPGVSTPCVADVDECFMDYDCVKDKKCCSNGCYTVCVSPAENIIAPAAAVKCPPPTSYRCSTTLKNECEDADTCSVGKICCFDGCRRRCIDDKTSSSLTDGVSVTCKKEEMQIDVKRGLLNGFKPTHLRLNDPSCKAQDNETHFSLIAPLMSCGTVSSHTDDAVVYSNTVKEEEVSYEGMITRIPELTIPFSCYYTKEGVTSTYGIIPRKLKMTMDGGDSTTEFVLEISVFKDQEYLLPYGIRDFPLKVALNKPLYVQLAVDSPDNRLELREEKCYATPTQDPDDSMKYDIIRQSCAVDSTVTYYDAPRGVRRFSFDTFQFSGDYGNFVYLHCNLVVCNASEPTSRCSVNCLNLEFPRRKRDTGNEKGVAKAGLSEGPFIFQREADMGARYNNRGKDSTFNITTVSVIAMAVFCAVCLGIIVYLKLKPAQRPKEYLPPDPDRETYI